MNFWRCREWLIDQMIRFWWWSKKQSYTIIKFTKERISANKFAIEQC